jgi:hypothetical protein
MLPLLIVPETVFHMNTALYHQLNTTHLVIHIPKIQRVTSQAPLLHRRQLLVETSSQNLSSQGFDGRRTEF